MLSSSSTPSSSAQQSICEVCWQPAHGKHFGVESCRACAAFFRRAVLNNFVKAACRLANGKCEPSLDGKFACKKCRIDRCFEVGMDFRKVQHDRDLVSSTENFRKRSHTKIPQSMQGFLGRPAFLLSCEPELAGTLKTQINVKFLVDHAHRFFTENTSTQIRNGMNGLNKLGRALLHTRRSSLPQQVLLKKVGINESLYFWEHEFLSVAEWLTNIDKFQASPTRLKLEILKAVWMIFGRLEKFVRASQMSRKNWSICSMTKDCSVDFENVELDTSWFTNYRLDQLTYFLIPADRFFVDHLIDPLTQLQPSIQEVTYIITHICFRHAAKKLTEVIPQLDQIMETLAADLHSYYINDLKLINYAGRLAKMMRICQLFERDNVDRMKRAQLADIFDVFCVEFSHPDVIGGIY